VVIVDGVAGPSLAAKETGVPVFSTDARHTAVTLHRQEGGFLRRRNEYGLALDGRVLAEVAGDNASGIPAFSPDGDGVAWWVRQGQVRRIYVNEEPHAPGLLAESDPVYTAAGRLVYAARPEPGASVTLAVDGRPGPLADDLAADRSVLSLFGRELWPVPVAPFAISPDGEHAAWIGLFDDAWHPVLDDRVGPAFDAPFTSSFDADGRATWYLQRGDVVHRVTAAP
jgi:hypothetical protein